MGNKIFLTFLVVILSFVALTAARPQSSGAKCGENSHFTSCGVSCPDRCGDNPLLGKICTADCLVGCECNSGYVLNQSGRCVQRSDCDRQLNQYN